MKNNGRDCVRLVIRGPKRYDETAILQALEYLNDGYDWIVDIDLERFLDTVSHDCLMNLVARTIDGRDVISLIRKFLVSSVQVNTEYYVNDNEKDMADYLEKLFLDNGIESKHIEKF